MGRPTSSPWLKCPDQIADVRFDLAVIMSKMSAPDTNGCIRYTGAHHSQGYGMCPGYRVGTNKRIMMTVHRLLLKIKTNSALTGVDAIHTCGHMYCHNPDHLVAGTAKDIAAGVRSRGNRARWGIKKGTELGRPRNQKYIYDQTRIVDLYKGTMSPKQFAAAENIPVWKANRVLYDMQKDVGYKWVKYC